MVGAATLFLDLTLGGQKPFVSKAQLLCVVLSRRQRTKEDLSSFKLLWDRPEQKPERKIQKER